MLGDYVLSVDVDDAVEDGSIDPLSGLVLRGAPGP